MASKSQRLIIETCLQVATSKPVSERILLYRSLAEFCAEAQLEARLCQMANDLDAAEKAHRELFETVITH